jgi:ankyrin repeat protein
VVAYLLDQGAPIVYRVGAAEDHTRDTALHWACLGTSGPPDSETRKANRLETVRLLARRIPDINTRFQGETPLMVAVKVGNRVAVLYLLENHPDINLEGTDYVGESALHLAVSRVASVRDPEARRSMARESAAVIKLLLARGAKQTPDRNGQTPLDLARKLGDPTILEAFGVRPPKEKPVPDAA